MLHCLRSCQSHPRILHQQFPHQILRLFRDIGPLLLPELGFIIYHSIHRLTEVGTFKGMLTREHNKDHHTKAPHVALLVIVPLKDLRSSILWGAAFPVQLLLSNNSAQSPVDNLDNPLFIFLLHQEIFGFKIPVGDVLAMRIEEGLQYFQANFRGLCFSERILCYEFANEFLAVE